MKLTEVIERLGLVVCTHSERSDIEVTGGYAGDLLSDVIANSKAGNVWVTIQVHPNIAAVAVLKDLAAIILANGRQPQSETLQKAKEEGVTLTTSALPCFELVGRLYEMGISRVG
ncbi:MAG: hypothetical protein AMJ84_02455 [Acidithiobacillales bacterium SM23_46]|nr:MAG: hypothetical protein AMJ84_02455 [Acidithiobacillales bacterium SM23_46]